MTTCNYGPILMSEFDLHRNSPANRDCLLENKSSNEYAKFSLNHEGEVDRSLCSVGQPVSRSLSIYDSRCATAQKSSIIWNDSLHRHKVHVTSFSVSPVTCYRITEPKSSIPCHAVKQHQFVDDCDVCVENTDDTSPLERLPQSYRQCHCIQVRDYQCGMLRKDSAIYFTNDQTQIPLHSYPPVRRKSLKVYEEFRQSFLFFLCLGFFRRFYSSCSSLFLLALIISMPIDTLSLLQKNADVLSLRDRQRCMSPKTNLKEIVETQRTIRSASDCLFSYSSDSIHDFCSHLISCARKSHKVRSNISDYSTSSVNVVTTDPNMIELSVNVRHDQSSLDPLCEVVSKKLDFELFCDIPVDLLLQFNFDTVRRAKNASHLCFDEMRQIKMNDDEARKHYQAFEQTFTQYATPLDYTIRWNSNQCLGSYKSWICTQHHVLYRYNSMCDREVWPPCFQHCLHVEASCPFFRIFNRTKLRGGQPTFICDGFDVAEKVKSSNCYQSATASTYTNKHHDENNMKSPLDVTTSRIRHNKFTTENSSSSRNGATVQATIVPSIIALLHISCILIYSSSNIQYFYFK